MYADLVFCVIGLVIIMCVFGWSVLRWRVGYAPPNPSDTAERRRPLSLKDCEDQEEEDDDYISHHKVIWLPAATMDALAIPWERRMGNPKDTAIGLCRLLAEEVADVAPYSLGDFLGSLRDWRNASGQAAVEGWEVYRQLGLLQSAHGSSKAAVASQAILRAVSAIPPSTPDADSPKAAN